MEKKNADHDISAMYIKLPVDIRSFIWNDFVVPDLMVREIMAAMESEDAQSLRFSKMVTLVRLLRNAPESVIRYLSRNDHTFCNALEMNEISKRFLLADDMHSSIAMTWMMIRYH